MILNEKKEKQQKKIHILFFGMPPGNNLIDGYSKWFSPIIKNLKKNDRLNVYYINYNKILNEKFEILRFILIPYLIYKLHKYKDEIDIVHVLRQNAWYYNIFYALKIKKNITPLKIITVHDIYTAKGKVNFKIIKNIAHADAIFCPSNYTANDIRTILKINKPVYVTYNPLDPSFYCMGTDDKLKMRKNILKERSSRKVLLSIASEMPRKNFEKLLEVLFLFNTSMKEKILLIKVGQFTKLRYKYINIAKKFGIENDILWINYANEKDLLYLYNISDIFITLSDVEGFCMPLIEAMACGLPIIGSKSSAIPEIVGNAGILVNNNDNKEIIEAINTLLYNIDKRNEVIENGFNRIRAFHEQEISRIYFESYLTALEKGLNVK
ncbi:MAG: glycosyltransferase family 4 protein [Methanomassiliicoccales archaeon]|nr:MAG: glycosyltransferase family 4 protein [Methanomassiliicoccales archaeon]